MRRVRSGELDALAVLFERHRRGLHRYFYRMLGDAPAAEDLVQTTFERILRYRRSFRGGSFPAWMYRIASNACRDLQDRRRRERTADLDEEPALPGHESPLALDVQALWAALQRLDPGEREVLILTKYQQLTVRDAATVLGCTEGALKVRVHRALKRLHAIHDRLSA